MKKIRLMMAEDHHLFRLGVQTLLKQEPQIEVVAEAHDGKQAIEKAFLHQPDVVLMDINLPEVDGIAATHRILQALPHTKILALTTMGEDDKIVAMVNAGALGYVLKDSTAPELLTAISTVSHGNTYFSKTVSNALLARLSGRAIKKSEPVPTESDHVPPSKLTKRELEILQHVAQERGNQQIAESLFISPRTVETHKRNLILKLKVKNVVGLARYYFEHFGDKA
jgi:DNA-binding NarL/FixJ family response regulator